jgi:TrmH family RNA methyltransferase
MLTKNERNSIKALRLKENRSRENLMVVEGIKGVLELLRSDLVTERIYVTSGYDVSEIESVAGSSEIIEVSSKDMEIMSSLKKAPGVLAVGSIKRYDGQHIIDRLSSNKVNGVPSILILDDLVDPGNVGTLIRTAHWFQLAGIVCSGRTADVWNTKSIQASMGSVFNFPICVTDPVAFIKDNKLTCAALDASGENLFESEYFPDAFIVGSESHGLSDGLLEQCEKTWAIPGSGKVESLNASVAGAIVTAELSRRWSLGKS